MVARSIVRPAGIDFDSPGRRDYHVALEHDTIWGDHLIPLTVFVGPEEKPGRGLVAFGSTHGNEYEGPIVIRHLLNEFDIARVRGRIILVPVLNVAAFRDGTRDSLRDDRVNLNRAFVDGAGRVPGISGITHRIADFVRTTIFPRVHVVIDIHSGGGSEFALCSSFHPIDDPAQSELIAETARWFGTPIIMNYQNATPGLLTSEAERLGKITVGTELGWGNSIRPDGVRYGRHGVTAAAIHHGQMEGRIEKIAHHLDGTQRIVETVDRDCLTVAPFPGHYESVVRCGETVERGALVGYLHDFNHLDMPPWPARAGVDGIIVAQAWSVPVVQGQHIVVTGRIRGR